MSGIISRKNSHGEEFLVGVPMVDFSRSLFYQMNMTFNKYCLSVCYIP